MTKEDGQRLELPFDRASRFLQAVYNHPAIYQGKDNPLRLTVDREGMEELSAMVLCPGADAGRDGYCRISVKYQHMDRPDPKQFESADYFAAEIEIPVRQMPSIGGFMPEASDGWDDFLESARKHDRQLPVPGIHRQSRGPDSGMVYLAGWDDETGRFFLQTEDFWSQPFSRQASGLTMYEYGLKTVEVFRQLARTVPEYLFRIGKNKLVERWAKNRIERARSKPAPWTIGALRKTGVQAEGQWLIPENSPEPDTYLAHGWLDRKDGWFVIVKSKHYESAAADSDFGTEELDVCFLLPESVRKLATDKKTADGLTGAYQKYLAEKLRVKNGVIAIKGPLKYPLRLVPTTVILGKDIYHPGLVAEGVYYVWNNRAECKKREDIINAFIKFVRDHDKKIPGFVKSLNR